MPDRDVAPAAADGADRTLKVETEIVHIVAFMDASEMAVRHFIAAVDRCEWCGPLRDAARPAPAAAPREGEPKHHGPQPDVSPNACVKCGEPWPCPEWTRECEAIIDRVGAKHDAADVAWRAYPRDSDSYKVTYKDGFGAGWDAAAREAARGEE